MKIFSSFQIPTKNPHLKMCFIIRWFQKKWTPSQQPVTEAIFERREYPQLSPCKQHLCENTQSETKLRRTAEWILNAKSTFIKKQKNFTTIKKEKTKKNILFSEQLHRFGRNGVNLGQSSFDKNFT